MLIVLIGVEQAGAFCGVMIANIDGYRCRAPDDYRGAVVAQ